MLKYINKIFQIFIDILMFIITFLILFALYNIISVKVFNKGYSNLFGITVFEIVSGSMEPTLNVKDIIVVYNTDKIKENDIITYTDDKDFITHRIIKIEGDTLTTKGDSNNSTDVRISKNKVIGKVILTIPKGGIIREILTTPKVIISVVITLVLFSLCVSYVPKNQREKYEFIDLAKKQKKSSKNIKKESIEYINIEKTKTESFEYIDLEKNKKDLIEYIDIENNKNDSLEFVDLKRSE